METEETIELIEATAGIMDLGRIVGCVRAAYGENNDSGETYTETALRVRDTNPELAAIMDAAKKRSDEIIDPQILDQICMSLRG